MKLLRKNEFLARVPLDDVYLVGVEKENQETNFHILAYTETLNEKPGYNEPTFMYIPADTEETDLWSAIASKLDDVKLYGGNFNEDEPLQEQYENQFLGSNAYIVALESTEEAMSLLKIVAEAFMVHEEASIYFAIVI